MNKPRPDATRRASHERDLTVQSLLFLHGPHAPRADLPFSEFWMMSSRIGFKTIFLPYFSLLVDQAFHPEASAKLRSPLSAAAEDLYWDDSVVTASSGCGDSTSNTSSVPPYTSSCPLVTIWWSV